MSTTVTMSLDEIRKLPPLTEEELRRLDETEPTPDEDCPAMTPEQLAQFRPWYEVHPERCPGKTQITLVVDTDVLEWFKTQGPRYQTRMSAALRAAAFPDGNATS